MHLPAGERLPLRIYIVRHGETEWSLSGQHTGRTDIPLTRRGEEEARGLGRSLQDVSFTHVLTSPRRRAQQTFELAALGPDAEVDVDLAEWDYGEYEGRRTAEILEVRPGWCLFRDGAPHGETPDDVSARADRVIARLRRLAGNIAVFTHGHLGRVLAARWIGLPVSSAQHFRLGTASLGILDDDPDHDGVPVIERWNDTMPAGKHAPSSVAPKDPIAPPASAESGHARSTILAINAGSSSLRLALVASDDPRRRILTGKIDRIGLSGATYTFTGPRVAAHGSLPPTAADRHAVVTFLLDWLAQQPALASLQAIGHRVVHGMSRSAPERVTPELMATLRGIIPLDPEHLPLTVALIEAFARRYPGLPQVVCFDTAFHRTMPRVARIVPIPRRYAARGVERYGFHGLSYESLMDELARLGDPAAIKGRIILAHLGSGASLAAVRDGESIDTSMGFTPTSGLVMSTRSGDLDPGLASYLAHTENMTSSQFQTMVTLESGLLGVSETSGDMRDLLGLEAQDVRAAEAVALFVYQVKKWIGAFAAALGGLDTLVFSGGVGEAAPVIRARVCEGLGFLGVDIDPARNTTQAPVISREGARVNVRILRCDEELMIARSVIHTLGTTMELATC